MFVGQSVSDLVVDQTVKEKCEFAQLQSQDDSLTSSRKDACENRGGFFYDRDVLYHKDFVLGEPVIQLVVPSDKREQVLKLAHESVWGAHLGIRKTSERIRYTFWWPGLRQCVTHFVNSCHDCQ